MGRERKARGGGGAGNEASRSGRPILASDRLLRKVKIPTNKQAENSREEAGNELLRFCFKSTPYIDLFIFVGKSGRMCFARISAYTIRISFLASSFLFFLGKLCQRGIVQQIRITNEREMRNNKEMVMKSRVRDAKIFASSTRVEKGAY